MNNKTKKTAIQAWEMAIIAGPDIFFSSIIKYGLQKFYSGVAVGMIIMGIVCLAVKVI